MRFLRYQSSTPTDRGSFTGLFGLANGLARSGRLTEPDWQWWRANNDWFNAAYPDPATRDPSLFDKEIHPAASCWFKNTASELVNRVSGYLDLLERYEIGWQLVESDDPGRVLYEDEYQVVVEPYSAGE